jgi:hypothetical protein
MGVLPDEIFNMTERDFAHLLAAAKMEHEEQEASWQRQKSR